MNDWFLGIWGLLLGVGDRGFLFRPHFGGKPPAFGRPPAHPSCGELDGLFFGWGLAQRLV